MTNSYKQIQLTNPSIGDVAVDAYLPYGRVTRRINAPYNCCNTFTIASSTSDTVVINDTGFYKVTYSLTGSAEAVGTITIALVVNGTPLYEVSQYVAAADELVNLTLPYTIRVCTSCSSSPENVPASVQIQNTGVALTGASSNMIVEKL